MSGTTALDVILELRLGVGQAPGRRRIAIGSDAIITVAVRDSQTLALVPGAAGVAALYWLPGTLEDLSAAQPLELVQVLPGEWKMVVAGRIPGTYTVWASIEEPARRATQVTFDVSSAGQITWSGASGVPWGNIEAVAAAAAVSAALPESRRVAVEAGSLAGEEAAKPYADNAAASETIALDAADLARSSEIAAAEERALAEVARLASEQASAASSANAAGSAITVLDRAALDALTSIPGTSPPQPLRALLLATVVSEGKNYRRNAANSLWVYESDALPAVQAQVAAVPARTTADRPDMPFAVKDDAGFLLAFIRALGDLVLAGGELRADGTLRTRVAELLGSSGGRLRFKDDAGFSVFDLGPDGLRAIGLDATPAALAAWGDLIAGGALRSSAADFLSSVGGRVTIKDAAGFVMLALAAEGFQVPGLTVAPDGALRAGTTLLRPDGTLALGPHALAPDGALSLPQVGLLPSTAAGFRIRDAAGFVAWQVDNAGLPTGGGVLPDATLSWSASEIAEEDARCRAISSEPSRRYRGDLAPLTAQILHFIVYGQSLSVGYESYPPVSKAQPYDNLMAGLSMHGQIAGTNWTPYGSSDFLPLVGSVRGGASGVMTADEVRALPATGNTAPGETVAEGALAFLRRAYLDARDATAPYLAHRFVASEAGVGGQPIEALSKGGSIGAFTRLGVMAGKVRDIAAGKGLSYGIPAYLWLQGEANYDVAGTYASDKASYKALLRQLVADLHADISVGIAGQARPAAFFTYQTGASFVRDATTAGVQIRLGPSMAQWEVAEEDPTVIMVGPVYPVPDKNGHLTANGTRWMGEQFGKVMRRVLLLRQDWRPLCPVRVRLRGRQVLIGFNVPAPPLQWGAPYAMNTTTLANVATTYANRGFVVVDDGGAITNATVELVGDCVVRLTLPRDPVGQVLVRYGSQVTGGQGCLMDSDDTPSVNTFAYLPEDGAGAPDNVPELIGKPYPLNNWCVLGEWPAVPA